MFSRWFHALVLAVAGLAVCASSASAVGWTEFKPEVTASPLPLFGGTTWAFPTHVDAGEGWVNDNMGRIVLRATGTTITASNPIVSTGGGFKSKFPQSNPASGYADIVYAVYVRERLNASSAMGHAFGLYGTNGTNWVCTPYPTAPTHVLIAGTNATIPTRNLFNLHTWTTSGGNSPTPSRWELRSGYDQAASIVQYAQQVSTNTWRIRTKYASVLRGMNQYDSSTDWVRWTHEATVTIAGGTTPYPLVTAPRADKGIYGYDLDTAYPSLPNFLGHVSMPWISQKVDASYLMEMSGGYKSSPSFGSLEGDFNNAVGLFESKVASDTGSPSAGTLPDDNDAIPTESGGASVALGFLPSWAQEAFNSLAGLWGSAASFFSFISLFNDYTQGG